MSTAKAMSKFEPVVVVDSSDSEHEISTAEWLRASEDSRASEVFRASEEYSRPSEVFRASEDSRAPTLPLHGPQASVTLLPQSLPSSGKMCATARPWTSGIPLRPSSPEILRQISRELMASTSDSGSDTETDLDFSTPPVKSSIKAGWENQKMGEDTSKVKSSDLSPPYDVFGPDEEDNETRRVEEEDYRYAVFLDMDLNGRVEKMEAQKRIRAMVEDDEKEDNKDDEKHPSKKQDRKGYWKERYYRQKKLKQLRKSSHFNVREPFIQKNFSGVQNFNRTFKKGPHGIDFKRATIPFSHGTVQHDLIVSSGKFFHRIVNGKAIQIVPNEKEMISVHNDLEFDADLIFQATFPNDVFPTNGPF